MKRLMVGTLVAAAILGGCALEASPSAPGNEATGSPNATVAGSAPASAKPVATPTSKFRTFSDGKAVVGTDIQAGTYRTRTASSGCYWERLSGFGGTMGEILANENTDGPAVVTIAASDKGFSSHRCGTWTTDLSAIVSGNTFPDGTYIVGTDLTAGTYRAPASPGCYWQRLKGFSGSMSDIIANENTDTGGIVTIAASDKGFQSSRCGTWTRQ
jgi:hypothetical protein